MTGRFARAWLSHLACAEGRSWIAAALGLIAFIVVMPISFGNVHPALALMLIGLGLGLGLVFRDGVAVVLGLAIAALAVCVSAGVTADVTLMAWASGSGWLLGLFWM